jgi:hypothetical protein
MGGTDRLSLAFGNTHGVYMALGREIIRFWRVESL